MLTDLRESCEVKYDLLSQNCFHELSGWAPLTHCFDNLRIDKCTYRLHSNVKRPMERDWNLLYCLICNSHFVANPVYLWFGCAEIRLHQAVGEITSAQVEERERNGREEGWEWQTIFRDYYPNTLLLPLSFILFLFLHFLCPSSLNIHALVQLHSTPKGVCSLEFICFSSINVLLNRTLILVKQ